MTQLNISRRHADMLANLSLLNDRINDGRATQDDRKSRDKIIARLPKELQTHAPLTMGWKQTNRWIQRQNITT